MEDVATNSSFLREGEEVENRTKHGSSPLMQVRKIPEPPGVIFGVCTRPLSELHRTEVAQLRVNERARGFYLLLRTLKSTVTGTVNSDFGRNALVVVEDHLKNRTFCCLFGHVHLRSEKELEELFPVNTVFALKEPILIACSEQEFAVVVGSPTDLVIIGRSHVLFNHAEALGWRKSTEEESDQLVWRWIQIGYNLFENGKFYDATDAYLFALNNCTENSLNSALNLNLAISFLVQECYESAVKHALNVLESEPLNESALNCAGRALYELGEYKKAKYYFEALKRLVPENTNYSAELVRCDERLSEAEGNVDIVKLYWAGLSEVTTQIDHGNFRRNIEFRPGLCNVRGVFATKDMEPGTLILVEKPVVTIFEPSYSSERAIVKFMRKAFRTVLNNPKTLGEKLRYLPGGCRITDENLSRFCDEVRELEPIVDVCRLYQTLRKNIFISKSDRLETAPFKYHVYEAASRFRHSCLANCSLLSYRGVIAVRTCASVLKGQELFILYYGNDLSFREKQEAPEQSGLTCGCSLCVLDKKELTEVHDLRQNLKRSFDAELALGAGVNVSAEERLLPIVKELELSYRYRDSERILLFIVYRDLAKIVDRSSEDWKDMVTLYVERGLQSLGLSTSFLLACVEQVNPDIAHIVSMPQVLFDFAGLMAEKEYSSGRLDLVVNWVKVIVLLERIYRGGNMDMLKRRFLDFKELLNFLAEFGKGVRI